MTVLIIQVEIERHDPMARALHMTPAARNRANAAYQEALRKAATDIDVQKLNPEFR